MIKVGKTLYKKDSKGKLRSWEIFVGEQGGVPIYSVKHGQDGGKMQETAVLVPEGKNVGRSNETTPEEQCRAEAQALYEKQMGRKGYTDTVPNDVPALPMLAHKYADYSHKIEWPAIVSAKIDGLRLVLSIKDGVATTISRTGKPLLGLEHITNELLPLKNIIIDGELYSDKYPFEEIISIVRKSKSTDPRMKDIFFYAFDLINGDSYHMRVVSLESFVAGSKHTKVVPWHIVKNEAEVKFYHNKFIAEGYEGTMVRNTKSLYQPNKRSYDLLKMKDFLDFEFEIVGWTVGKGKFANIPTFKLITNDKKTFEAVPKGDEEIRGEYLKNADSYIGAKATIRFFEYTADGIPRFPVMVGIRDYE